MDAWRRSYGAGFLLDGCADVHMTGCQSLQPSHGLSFAILALAFLTVMAIERRAVLPGAAAGDPGRILVAPATGALRLRNRLVHASMTTRMAQDARVTQALVDYHETRAMGGAALIVTEPLKRL